MPPDDRVAAQITAAMSRRAAARARRARLQRARQHGLKARHAAKLRALAERDHDQPPTPA